MSHEQALKVWMALAPHIREKLDVYFKATGGRYTGGWNYSTLIREIEQAEALSREALEQ